jgi:hypothetical protein
MTTDRAKRYTQHREAPRDGELVLFCAHAEITEERLFLAAPIHFYWIEGGAVRDGEEIETKHAAVCEACHMAIVGGARLESLITQDAEWVGPPLEIAALV